MKKTQPYTDMYLDKEGYLLWFLDNHNIFLWYYTKTRQAKVF